jgi:hypothetical protein
MARVRILKPEPPSPPPRKMIEVNPGEIYTCDGVAYFLQFQQREALGLYQYALMNIDTGEKTTVWMSLMHMKYHLNDHSVHFIHRPKAEVLIPLEPGELSY